MDVAAAQAAIRHAQDDLTHALAALDDTPPPEPEPPPLVVSTPEEFDAALGAALPGDRIVCALTLVYPTALTLRVAGITICAETDGLGRMTLDVPAPSFGPMTIEAEAVTLRGLQLATAERRDVLVLRGAGPVIDRCRILGDPVTGTKRGIAANAPNVTITRCYIDYCHGPYPGDDTQAICLWNTPGPITITDSYRCGGTETIMVGGADPSSAANIPSDILIEYNTITKRPEWQAAAVSVKNTLELKNARRVRIAHNEISRSWGGHGQDGYLLVFTPRNQSGTAPYSTVEDVVVEDNHLASGAAAVSVSGDDDLHPSQRLARVTVRRNVFEDIDPKKYTGTNKLFLIQRGPTDVTIDANDVHGANLGSQIYFDGSPPCDHLVVTNNRWPSAKYGIFGSGCSTAIDPNGLPNAWNRYVASGTLANNTVWPGTSTWARLCQRLGLPRRLFGDDAE
jgi:hypothetical protein